MPPPSTLREILDAVIPEGLQVNAWLDDAEPDCVFSEFDMSFFNGKHRVFNKYKEIAGFSKYESMMPDDLAKMTQAPAAGRDVILGMTEFLLPYVAYISKRMGAGNINAPTKLPFMFFAPKEWSDKGNMHFIDCLAAEFLAPSGNFNRLVIFLPADKSKWLTPTGLPRVTIKELWRLEKQIGKPLEIQETTTGTLDGAEYVRFVVAMRKKGGRRGGAGAGAGAGASERRTRRKTSSLSNVTRRRRLRKITRRNT